MVSLLDRNYNTNYCEFSYDDWNLDEDYLPTQNKQGKGVLSTIKSCCQGSFAIGTDGTIKVLCGDNNQWIDYK